MAAKVYCISVIDENQNSASNTYFNNSWTTFRNNYPFREFWLLDPGGGAFGYVPPDYTADPFAFGPITVNRDNNVLANRSDWFAICGLDNAEDGSVVSLAVDTSGSMNLNTVNQSYQYFISRCNARNFTLVIDTTFPNERWIDPHNKSVPPNSAITVTPSTILRNTGSATLAWTTAGDVTNITIDQGIGTNLDLSGSVIVSPTNTTQYNLSVVGPAGQDGSSATLTVVDLPNITSLSANPNPQTSGNDGIPNYDTTLTWNGSTDLAIISGKITSTYGGSTETINITNPNISGSRTVTSLPQSVAGTSTTRTYTLELCHSLGCSTRSVTVTVTNDNDPTNTWTTEFTGLNPLTEYVKLIGTFAGIDMKTSVSSPDNTVFFANGVNASYANPQIFDPGQNVYIKMTSLDFNTDLSGLPPDQTFGKTNTRTVSVTAGTDTFNVSYVTRPPNIGETFDFDGAVGAYPYTDIDLISNTPVQYLATQTLPMDDIDVQVEVKVDDPNAQVKINNGNWTYVREI